MAGSPLVNPFIFVKFASKLGVCAHIPKGVNGMFRPANSNIKLI